MPRVCYHLLRYTLYGSDHKRPTSKYKEYNILSRAISLRAPSFGGVRTWVEGSSVWSSHYAAEASIIIQQLTRYTNPQTTTRLALRVGRDNMFYIVVKFQTPSYNTFWDMNFFSSLIFGQVQTDGRKAMHMSPQCIRTGGLKNQGQTVQAGEHRQTILHTILLFYCYTDNRWNFPLPVIVSHSIDHQFCFLGR